MTMNIRGVGWGSWSVSVLLNKVSARRIISQYINTLVLSFIALFYLLIIPCWQGFTLLSPIAYNQATLLHRKAETEKARRKASRFRHGKRQGGKGKARRTEPKKASQNAHTKGRQGPGTGSIVLNSIVFN